MHGDAMSGQRKSSSSSGSSRRIEDCNTGRQWEERSAGCGSSSRRGWSRHEEVNASADDSLSLSLASPPSLPSPTTATPTPKKTASALVCSSCCYGLEMSPFLTVAESVDRERHRDTLSGSSHFRVSSRRSVTCHLYSIRCSGH